LNEKAGTPGAGELTLTVTIHVPSSFKPTVFAAFNAAHPSSTNPALAARDFIVLQKIMILPFLWLVSGVLHRMLQIEVAGEYLTVSNRGAENEEGLISKAFGAPGV
jgi:hypothetical protein